MRLVFGVWCARREQYRQNTEQISKKINLLSIISSNCCLVLGAKRISGISCYKARFATFCIPNHKHFKFVPFDVSVRACNSRLQELHTESRPVFYSCSSLGFDRVILWRFGLHNQQVSAKLVILCNKQNLLWLGSGRWEDIRWLRPDFALLSFWA